jgi:hypothetical protein
VGCKKTVIGKEVSVNGKFAVYSPGWPDDPLPLRQITWVDGNTGINLYGDASKFSFEDLMAMAGSVS